MKVQKILLLSAISANRPFTQIELDELTRKAMRRSVTKETGRLLYSGGRGQSYQVFEVYRMYDLCAFKRTLYFLRKGFAATLGYFGLNTVLVIVKS